MAKILIAVLVALFACQSAWAASTKTKKHPRHYTEQQQGQIACGKYGCARIPPNCHPTTDYDWWGNPTGYDRVVCR
jgi:hypothetical protein